MASNRVIEQYKRERDKYQRKIRTMERKNPDYDWREIMGWGMGLRDVRKLSTAKVKTLIRDMQGFTAKYGHVLEDRSGVRAPRAYWEKYDRALRRENARRDRARKTAMTKYEVPNNLKPPTNNVKDRFAKFVAHVIDLADPFYRYRRTKQMQDNYIGILSDALANYEEAYRNHKLDSDKVIELIKILKKTIGYVSSLTPDEFYRKYVSDTENRIDFEVIYIQDEWELDDIIEDFTEIYETWRRL